MAGAPLPKTNLDHALQIFSRLLQKNKIEHFVFFGTLLGLTRDHSTIAGDDDVDFYVNKRFFGSVAKIIQDLGVVIDSSKHPNESEWFLQVKTNIDNLDIQVDFYFYDTVSNKDYLLEYWNFPGRPSDINNVLKVPKVFVFPIRPTTYRGQEVNIPNLPELICEFLYGINWRIPMRKKLDYVATTIGGRPVRFKQGKSQGLELLP